MGEDDGRENARIEAKRTAARVREGAGAGIHADPDPVETHPETSGRTRLERRRHAPAARPDEHDLVGIDAGRRGHGGARQDA